MLKQKQFASANQSSAAAASIISTSWSKLVESMFSIVLINH